MFHNNPENLIFEIFIDFHKDILWYVETVNLAFCKIDNGFTWKRSIGNKSEIFIVRHEVLMYQK